METRTLITGGSGSIGIELQKLMPKATYVSFEDYDLRSEKGVYDMFENVKPTRVLHLAARVGGIFDNIKYPVEYLEDNILMNTLIVNYAKYFQVERFTGILSTSSYPETAKSYPMTENMFFGGPPEATSFNYAYSKRVLGLQIDSYNKQYGLKYNYVIPCNLYSKNMGDINKLHFIQALIKKILIAKENNDKHITLMGTGTPLRQFMYSKDLAFILYKMIQYDITDSFNIAPSNNLSIKEIASIVMSAMKVNYPIVWDQSKPDGQYRRDVSTEKFNKYFPGFQFTSLYDGVLDILNDQTN